MPGQPTPRTPSKRLRLFAVMTILAATAGLTFLWQAAGQAGAANFTEKTFAFFPTKDKLQVAVALTANPGQELNGTLQVDLVNAAGQVVKSSSRVINQKEPLAYHSFELAANQDQAKGLKLRTHFLGKQQERPLATTLLLKAHETALTASKEFFTGSRGALRCQVQAVRSLLESFPLPGATVEVVLREKDKTHTLYQGKTDGKGEALAKFQLPDLAEGQYSLEVTTTSALGKETLKHNVQIRADAKILLVTDKPIYQPGQEMHVRALVLRPFDLKPVDNAELLFEIEDAKGNKVFKKFLKTSKFGVTAVDFQLADEVIMGNYQIRASVGSYRSDKTVQVKRYVLPKFKVEVSSDKKFYLPKETIKGSLQSDYFFGKPVANSAVEITASTFDVEFKKFQTWKGKTDDNGHTKFEIQLPAYFVGQPLQQGKGMVKLEVKVLDNADHTEKVTKSYTVSDQPIQVNLIPEGGKLVPEMKNRVFVSAIYPDGSPAVAEVQVWSGKESKGQPLTTVKTNASGLAEMTVTPKEKEFRAGEHKQQKIEILGGEQFVWGPTILFDMSAQAKDQKGNIAKSTFALNAHPMGENVLLHLNKAIYQSGDSLKAEIVTSAGLPTAYLDIIRNGQVLLSNWFEVKDGKASYNLDLPQDIFGSVEVHAYQMLASGEIIRDTRVIYVQPATALKVKVEANKSVFGPGEAGQIQFHVTDDKGNPTAAALGVIVVDEAVYALQELHPGLEKLYFTLQEELLKPQVDAKITSLGNIDNLVLQPALPVGQQQVAQVLLNGVQVKAPAAWQVNPAMQRKQEAQSHFQQIGWSFWNYAQNHDDFLQYNKAAKKWEFNPDLMQKLIKANQIQPATLQALQGPSGEALNFTDLQKLEKQFTPENLASAVTHQRMSTLSWWVVHYTNQNKAQYFKNGQWVLAQDVIDKAVKQNGGGNKTWERDAWGNVFWLNYSKDKLQNPNGQPQLDHYQIVSAGPDGKFQTKDDLKGASTHPYWQAGNTWWDGMYMYGQMNPLAFDQKHMWAKRQNFANGMGMPGMPVAEMAMPMMMKGGAAGGGGGLPPMAKMPTPDMAGTGVAQGKSEGGAAPITKVREYFPETMLWQPALITDDKGQAVMAINFADSITTWRLTASANSMNGGLGGTTVPLKVFQDFFVDIDLPVTLTQSDEVAFPVAVYNYLTTPQQVKIELQNEKWFELLDAGGAVRTLNLQPNEVTAVKFRIKASKVGNQPITVKAYGSKKSDAVKRIVEVVPNGEKFERVVNDKLEGSITQTIAIPQDAIPDSSKLMVKLYPGIMSQLAEGLEGMLRMPGGCFEQTSSSAYPNVLIVDYIKKNKLATPDILMKAESYLNTGYQRLLTFERPGGGFDWWGSGTPLIWLSAYGLQEFNDMSKVWPIDKGIIDRTQNFLMNKMDKDGTWSVVGDTHGETIASMGNPKLLLTSYVTWSLLESGFAKDKLARSVDYIRANVNEAGDNAYILALAANALASYDPKHLSTLNVLGQLEKLRKEMPQDQAICFPAKAASLTYATGESVTVETTALTVMAMLKAGYSVNSINKGLNYLVKTRQGSGAWGSTQASILALKALLGGMGGMRHEGETPFTILVNGKEAARGKITEENADMLHAFDLKPFTQIGDNRVEIKVEGKTALMYQIVGRYYQPWKEKQEPETKPAFDVKVAYDRTKLATHDMLRATATLKYLGQGETNMVMLELGIAPGFTIDAGDFAEMVDKKAIQKFSITSNKVILYMGKVMQPGDVRTFEYTLRAKYPLRAQTPPTVAYEYYTPAHRGVAQPIELTVTDKKGQ